MPSLWVLIIACQVSGTTQVRSAAHISHNAGINLQEDAQPGLNTTANTTGLVPPLPAHLVERLRAGRVIAFVGSGFSNGCGLPRWKDLLEGIVARAISKKHHIEKYGRLHRRVRNTVNELLDRPRPAYEAAAQEIEARTSELCDKKGLRCAPQEVMVAYISQILTVPLPLNDNMLTRLSGLLGTNFRAILTTNYNGFIQGPTPFDADIGQYYHDVLVPRTPKISGKVVSPRSRQALSFVAARCPVIQIHGNLFNSESVVLAKPAYDRLMANNAYTKFMKTVMAHYTLLFIGSSLSDIYIQEFLAEAYALRRDREQGNPIAYAMLNDKTEEQIGSWRRNQGIQVLPWRSAEEPAAFEEYMQLFQAAAPRP